MLSLNTRRLGLLGISCIKGRPACDRCMRRVEMSIRGGSWIVLPRCCGLSKMESTMLPLMGQTWCRHLLGLCLEILRLPLLGTMPGLHRMWELRPTEYSICSQEALRLLSPIPTCLSTQRVSAISMDTSCGDIQMAQFMRRI